MPRIDATCGFRNQLRTSDVSNMIPNVFLHLATGVITVPKASTGVCPFISFVMGGQVCKSLHCPTAANLAFLSDRVPSRSVVFVITEYHCFYLCILCLYCGTLSHTQHQF
jgi:hypothetical protein